MPRLVCNRYVNQTKPRVGRSEEKNRKHLSCNGNENVTMDKGYNQKKDHVRNQFIQADAKVYSMATFPKQKILH